MVNSLNLNKNQEVALVIGSCLLWHIGLHQFWFWSSSIFGRRLSGINRDWWNWRNWPTLIWNWRNTLRDLQTEYYFTQIHQSGFDFFHWNE